MEEQAKQAWITSLRFLAATPKTRKELEKRLLEKGYTSSQVQETLDRLETQGLLSDSRYAKDLVAKFTQGKLSGRRKISFELKRHGVPSQIQKEVLSNLSEEDEMARAKELALAKWGQCSRLDQSKRQKKVFDFLIRRGFEFQLAKDIIEELDSFYEDDNR